MLREDAPYIISQRSLVMCKVARYFASSRAILAISRLCWKRRSQYWGAGGVKRRTVRQPDEGEDAAKGDLTRCIGLEKHEQPGEQQPPEALPNLPKGTYADKK